MTSLTPHARVVPDVEPLTGGRHGRAFGSALTPPAERGMVEEEFLFTGMAHAFTPIGAVTADGRWRLAERGPAPYTTRMLVTRPAAAEDFNGTVVLEWANVSSGYDVALAGPFLTAETGFAHVLVSVQSDGVHGYPSSPAGLTAWDAERYGRLSLPDDALSYDVFTQAARLVGAQRDRSGVDPMAGLPVRHVIATGGSQSGARLLAYLNGVQPREGAFDAFLPFLCAGHATDFGSERGHADPGAPDYDVRRRHTRATPTHVREDLGVPVLQLNSEAEAVHYRAAWQPDSALYRYWEVAGSSHGPAELLELLHVMADRDGVAVGDWARPRGTTVSWGPVLEAALVHLDRWTEGGVPAPSQPLLRTSGQPPAIDRDELRNALGGVRTPEADVPVGAYADGRFTPFDSEQLTRLYGSDAEYRRRLVNAAHAAAAAGTILRTRVDRLAASARLPTEFRIA